MRASISIGMAVALIASISVVGAQTVNPDKLPRADPTSSATESSTREPNATERPADFGPAGFWYSSLDGSQVHPRQNTATYERGIASGAYYCKTGTPENEAFGQVQVPHGSMLVFFRVWLYDDQATSAVRAEMEQLCLPDFGAGFPTTTSLGTVQTTNAFAGGNFGDFANIPANTLADNQSCTYRFRVAVGTNGCPGSISLGFFKGRVHWERFVPVAPAAATFSDVPVGAQFRREIEALAASGITAGCTATTFCPDNFVTRRQMAAFFGRAFGLPEVTIADPANP